MEQALVDEMKKKFKSSFFLSLCSWIIRDKTGFPPQYIQRMEAGFLEGFALINECEMTIAYRDRLLAFHNKMFRLEAEFAHLL